MARDEALYTGMTSQSRSTERRKEAKQEKAEKRAKLLPFAEIVNDIIEKEKVTQSDVKSFVLEGVTQDDLLIEMKVRQRLVERLSSVQGRIANIMHSPEKIKEAQDDK